jgi:Universal stress protein family
MHLFYFLHLHTDERETHVPQSTPHLQAFGERGIAIARARAAMASLVSKAEKAGVRATPLLVFTEAQEWIEAYVKAYAIDLVIMGLHRTSELKQRLIGSTALEFVRHIEAVPVLIIKERDNEKEFNLRRIVFASDFKTDWIRPFETIAELAAIYEATIDWSQHASSRYAL